MWIESRLGEQDAAARSVRAADLLITEKAIERRRDAELPVISPSRAKWHGLQPADG